VVTARRFLRINVIGDRARIHRDADKLKEQVIDANEMMMLMTVMINQSINQSKTN